MYKVMMASVAVFTATRDQLLGLSKKLSRVPNGIPIKEYDDDNYLTQLSGDGEV